MDDSGAGTLKVTPIEIQFKTLINLERECHPKKIH